jgi:hypothetical protein
MFKKRSQELETISSSVSLTEVCRLRGFFWPLHWAGEELSTREGLTPRNECESKLIAKVVVSDEGLDRLDTKRVVTIREFPPFDSTQCQPNQTSNDHPRTDRIRPVPISLRLPPLTLTTLTTRRHVLASWPGRHRGPHPYHGPNEQRSTRQQFHGHRSSGPLLHR